MKKIVFILLFLFVAAAVTFLLLCRDDAELLLSSDIDLYAIQPETSERSFHILLEASKQELPYQDVPNGLSQKQIEEDSYKELLRENRELIIQNFALAKGFLDELRSLDNFDAIGDTSINYESQTVQFRAMRDMLRAVCLYTELSYVEDLNEKGLDALLQIQEISAKWLPHTRTLLHCMMSTVILGSIGDTISYIEPYLGTDSVEKVMEVYSQPIDFTKAIENALYSEYCMAANTLDGILSEGQRGLVYVLFKPKRTLNIYSEYLQEAIALSRLQDWQALSEKSAHLETEFDRFHMTNWGGWTFLAMTVPSTDSVLKKAYEYELKDLELIEKLEQKSLLKQMTRL